MYSEWSPTRRTSRYYSERVKAQRRENTDSQIERIDVDGKVFRISNKNEGES